MSRQLPNYPFYIDETTGAITGIKNPDGTVTLFRTAADTAAALAAYNASGVVLQPDAVVVPGEEVTADGVLPSVGFVELNKADGALAMTVTPTPGLFLVIRQKDAGTHGHTVTTLGTYDGTNNTATFNAANEALVLFGLSSTRWAIVANIGSVALSAV